MLVKNQESRIKEREVETRVATVREKKTGYSSHLEIQLEHARRERVGRVIECFAAGEAIVAV